MKYQQWDKKSDIDNKTALELIGEEQMQNDDVFILFTDNNDNFISLESIATLKAIYDFKGTTVDEVSKEYIEHKQTETTPPTSEIDELKQQLAKQQELIDKLLAAVKTV